MKDKTQFPNYLVAVDKKKRRVFVLAQPSLCAIKISGQWQNCQPLSDEEIQHYDLVTDLSEALALVNEARRSLIGSCSS